MIEELTSSYATEEEINSLKNHVMKWYDLGDDEHFYKDALEDLLGMLIYGHYGEYHKTALLLSSWKKEKMLARSREDLDAHLVNLLNKAGKVLDDVKYSEKKCELRDAFLGVKETREGSSLCDREPGDIIADINVVRQIIEASKLLPTY